MENTNKTAGKTATDGVRVTETQITKLNKALRRAMLDQEIYSLHYENVIGVGKGYKIIDAGKVLDILDTNEKIESLWDEYCEQEGINQEVRELTVGGAN